MNTTAPLLEVTPQTIEFTLGVAADRKLSHL